MKLIISLSIFILVFLISFLIFRFSYRKIKKWVAKTPGQIDDYVLDIFKVPALWLFFWILFKVFAFVSLSEFTFSGYLSHINNILLIISVAWVITRFVKLGAYWLQKKLDINQKDNLNARKSLTQINVFQSIINTVIIIVALSISLLTFNKARAIGVSLLTSAGIVGIIVGFAAQKSLAMILAGIQIALTQPIRLDDVVIVEGEWGRIEEITLTYVVVKIWDERRLVLPVNYFLEKPFQNWTRKKADIMGTIFIYVDYAFPVECIREVLPNFLKADENWDGRIGNVQVTNTNERSKEIRILVSSSDASKNWDLRVAIREKIIDFINENYPETFARIRLEEV